MNLLDLFTQKELNLACQLDSVQEILEQIITDKKLKHINKVTNQENDKRYFAYILLNYKLQTKGKL